MHVKLLVTAVGLAVASISAQAATKPTFIKGNIIKNVYDGVSNDLLTAGLGKTGLAGAAPAFANPAAPTTVEQRQRAIYNNYRALLDMTVAGGYGRFYGPNIDNRGNDTLGEGKIAGEEYLAFADDGTGKKNVTLMIQLPASFNPAKACIVTATASGSRGIYGAIATSGDWGLKQGCAVAYTDKGTGMGVHDLQANTVNLITGDRADAATAGALSNFTATLSASERSSYNQAYPNRIAFKHAHSQQNPEQDWGKNTLQAVEFAFYVLNSKGIGSFSKTNTVVIASSVSNGGGAALRAAEQDLLGLVDGVAVSEPNVQPTYYPNLFSIRQGNQAPVTAHSKSLLDYMTLYNLYQPCAGLANPTAPLNANTPALAANRCTSLKEKGLLTGITQAEQASEAQAIINAAGILPEQNLTAPGHDFLAVYRSIAVTYANAYGKFGVAENVCGFSLAFTDASGNVIPAPAASLAGIFAAGNGVPPTAGVNLVNNTAVGGAKEDRVSVSASTNRQDMNIDGAICLRNLAVGKDIVTGKTLPSDLYLKSVRIAAGITGVRATGNLRRLPAVIVNGRADAILAPNHTSRAYVGLNRALEGNNSKLHYYEVTNTHHLDTLNGLAGYNARYVPLHVYFVQALNLMYDHLTTGKTLPASQVVRAVPRGTNPDGSVPPLSSSHLPAISSAPAADALITYSGGQLNIPE